jgi:hypothetical protein
MKGHLQNAGGLSLPVSAVGPTLPDPSVHVAQPDVPLAQ